MTTRSDTSPKAVTFPPLEAVLAAGLAWLDETPQHPEAICNHHGVTMSADGDRSLKFIPRAANQLPAVVLTAYRRHATGPVLLEDGELDVFADMIRAAGYIVTKTWGGDGSDSGSVGLAKMPHPTLTDAVLRYHAGCPHHGGSVFCGGWQARTQGELLCKYLTDGYGLLTEPTVSVMAPAVDNAETRADAAVDDLLMDALERTLGGE